MASLSAVYSLAVEKHALWLLSGLEGGSINLQSVRHNEGKRISTLRGHTSAVSVLNLANDEQSFLSGSWDKNILDWDLNTGKVTRNFEGSTGQISTLDIRPQSSIPVPETSGEVTDSTQGFSSNNVDQPKLNGNNGVDDDQDDLFGDQSAAVNGTLGSPADSLFGGNDADSLFGDSENVGAVGSTFDDAETFTKTLTDEEPPPNEDKPPHANEQDAEGDITMTESAKPNEGLPAGEPTLEDAGLPPSEQETDRLFNEESRTLPHGDEPMGHVKSEPGTEAQDTPPAPGVVFLAASFDGSLRIWDKRQPSMVAKMAPQNVPPWCMNACWSPDGNAIYAGRRNGTVDEYNIHKGLHKPTRNFKLPYNSGPVSAVKVMPNGRHLIW